MELKIDMNFVLFLVTLLLTTLISPPSIVFYFIFLLVFPGFMVTKLLVNNSFSLSEVLILSLGVGASFISLVTYLFKYLNIPLNVFSIILVLLSLFLIFNKYERVGNFKLRMSLKRKFGLSTLLVAILMFGLLTRLYPIKGMNAPLFADSAVSGTIAKLIVDNQKIPDTWEQFLPIRLNHQPGFASIVAWFHIFSKLQIPTIILFLTNLFHGLFPLTVYLLCYQLTKNKLQSIVASSISLASSFPTYIFVAGMNTGVLAYFLVPLALAITINCLKNLDYKSCFLLSLISVGAFLIHPIFIFFYVLFFTSYSFFLLSKGSKAVVLKSIFTLFFVSVIIPVLVTYPYFSRAVSADISDLAIEQWHIQSSYINPMDKISALFFVEPLFVLFNNLNGFWYLYLNQISLSTLVIVYPVALVLLAFFFYSLYTIFKERSKTGYLIVVWYLLFVFFSSLQSYYEIKFPGWMYVYPSRVKFLIGLPVSLLLSYGFTQKKMLERHSMIFTVLLIVVAIDLVFIVKHLSSIAVSPLSDRDLEAIDWIGENTSGGTILNTITDIEAGAFIGGPGQWIPALIGRPVVFPATSLTDDLLHPDIQGRVKIMENMEEGGIDDIGFFKLLKSYNVSHVFVSKNSMQSREKFKQVSPQLFLTSPNYKLEYMNADAFVFKVVYPDNVENSSSTFPLP